MDSRKSRKKSDRSIRKGGGYRHVVYKLDEMSPFHNTWGEHYDDLVQGVESVADDPAPMDPYECYSWFFGFDDNDDISSSVQKYMEPPKEIVEDPDGNMQEVVTHRPNPLVFSLRTGPDGRTYSRYAVLFRDKWKEKLAYACNQPFAITNLMAYYGNRNLLKNMGVAYGLIIDLDGVDGNRLATLVEASHRYPDMYPTPNVIALSGTGAHLYFAFAKPAIMTQKMKDWMQWLKANLIVTLWNQYTSVIPKPQMQGINQGFRPISGQTKVEGITVKAWRISYERWDLFGKEGLERYISNSSRMLLKGRYVEPPHPEDDSNEDGNHLTFEKAKVLYPEWAERVEKEKEEGREHTIRGWKTSDAFYEFWKGLVTDGARVGRRYWNLWTLSLAAVKSEIPMERLRKDADELQKRFDALGGIVAPFSEQDEMDALKGYQDPKAKRYTFRFMLNMAGLEYTPKNKQKNKLEAYYQRMEVEAALRGEVYVREKMTREKWLEVYCRPMAKRSWLLHPDPDWRTRNKRRTSQPIVQKWLDSHPYGRSRDCIRDTGLTLQVVSRYWQTCGGHSSAETAVEAYRKANPEGTREDFIRESGYSERTVRQYWKKR